MSGMLGNGAPLPNWVKLIVIGVGVGVIWAGQQSAVGQLQVGQKETTAAIQELKVEMRDRLVTKGEFEVATQRIESNARRIDALEIKQLGIQGRQAEFQEKLREVTP